MNPPSALPVQLVLHNVRSLHNVGAILRTAEASGISKVFFSGLTPTPPRHEIEKTSLGALQTLQWETIDNLNSWLDERKKFHIYAIEQTPIAKPLYEEVLLFPAIFIVGHEREGIEPEILSKTDTHLVIPMQGTSVHSLNVSNATSIAVYEAVRQFWYARGTTQ